MPPGSNAYDELAYESLPIPGTAPPRLSRASALHGGPRPPERGFRLLELGCGDGANLLPLAFYDAEAGLVGIDSARSAIAAAREAAACLELANVRFEVRDLARGPVPEDVGFDYVIVHGVFSWVDAPTREALLRIAHAALARRGVLYLSHNVRAGWVVRGLVRDLLRGLTTDEGGPHERVRQARRIAAALSSVVAASEDAYHVLLTYELERVAGASDGYLYHEYLCEQNVAFDHAEIVALLAGHGLAYLCDAWHDAPEGCVPPPLRQALQGLGLQRAALDRAADVLGYRRFRASVFCRREEQGPPPDPAPEPASPEPVAHPPRAPSPDAGPHRLAVFEAARRGTVTAPDHTLLALGEEERAWIGLLAAGRSGDVPAGFVEELARAGLLVRQA